MNAPGCLGPHGHDFGALAAVLARFAGQRLVFVPNPGNAGDNLINLGMYRLFDDLGVDFEVGDRAGHYPGRVLVYSGGGALVDIYPGAADFFARNHRDCQALILLPHTVRTAGDLIAQMDGRCILFAREAASLAYLQAAATGGAEVGFCHDMAFYLGPQDLKGAPWHLGLLADRGLLLPWVKMLIKIGWRDRLRGPRLQALRTDIEAAGPGTTHRSHDLSALFALADMSRPACEVTARAVCHILQRFPVIATDRLHIAIASAILGREVWMRDNSYGKNRDIYTASMADYFTSVSFQ